jgi:hypothetical protein
MSGSNSASQSAGYTGIGNFNTSTGSLLNLVTYICQQIIAGKTHSQLVKVMSVSGGGLSGVPMVNVQPMVSQSDGLGNLTPHGTIYNIPAMRPQSGSLAIVMDPQVGDIGHMICCDRDVSNVKATGQIGGPGSSRQHDWSDGMFVGGYTSLAQGAAPTTYIQITPDDGVNITSANNLVLNIMQDVTMTVQGNVTMMTQGNCSETVSGTKTITATNITLDAAGNLSVTGDVMGGA